MRYLTAILAAAMVVSLTSCVDGGKKASAKSVTPPPAPAAKPAPPAPQPLSTPQTQVQLPPPQPVNPEALAAAPQPEEQVEMPAAPRATRRAVGPPAIAPPRSEQAQSTQPPVVAAPVDERAPIGEIVPASETRRLQDSADAHKREIKQLLDQARARGLTRRQQSAASHIESFVKLSDQAEAKGDMREADALAERALVLAKDLQGVR